MREHTPSLCRGSQRKVPFVLAVFLLASLVPPAPAQSDSWTTTNGETVVAAYAGFAEGKVALRKPDGAAAALAFDQLIPTDRQRVLALEDGPRPLASPPWLPGYRVRYPLRVVGDLAAQTSRTVVASIPTGGWLKTNASDLVATTVSGRRIAAFVLSHDARGDTLIQFRRSGLDRWYWAYASNPSAPDADPAQARRLAAVRQAAEDAALRKMAAMKHSAERAAVLRDLEAELARQRETATNATRELAQWATIQPQREEAARQAAAKVPPAQAAARQAADAHVPFQKAADEKTEAARAASAASAAAAAAAQAVGAENSAALQAVAAANAALTAAEALLRTSQVQQVKAQAAAEVSKAREAANARQSALAALAPRKTAADADAAARQKLADAAADAAKAARLAAAPAATAKQAADDLLAQLTAASRAAAAAVEDGRQRIAAATELKRKSEAELVRLLPGLEPARQAAAASAAAAEQTVAASEARESEYFDLAGELDPRVFREGLTVEFREWAGDRLRSWPDVVSGLQRSDNVLGNGVVTEIVQNENPFRRGSPRNFAASYRGYLRAGVPGVYSFFVNGDDATFLFVNGYSVYSRPGSNRPIGGKVRLYSVGADIQLEAGVHPFEVHHIVGNTPDASGQCSLLWVRPGSKAWEFVPASAFASSLLAVAAGVEAPDGGTVAALDFGMDDALSSDGLALYLARFGAQGTLANPAALRWDFGDGTRAVGLSPRHVFFTAGAREVSLQSHPALPPFRRRCHVFTPPVPTSPHSLGRAVEALAATDLTALPRPAQNDAYHFLTLCGQPGRWPVLERLCRLLLQQTDLDPAYRAQAYASLMEAIAAQGRGVEALKLTEPALRDLGRFRTLKARVLLGAAIVNRDYLRDFGAADSLYAQVLRETQRLRHPIVQQAAVAWGDLFVEAGDLARAGETYRLAKSLGAIGFSGEALGDPARRGALLRVAEQQLGDGNIQQTRRLLRRIEVEFPEQKIEGLYRFLRGESDRFAGLYDQAMSHYEVLLDLRQWAGYRPQALFGLADANARAGELDKALEWLAALKDAHPSFFEEKQLAAYRDTIEKRRARLLEAPAAGTQAPPAPGAHGGVTNAMFAGLTSDFESEDPAAVAGRARVHACLGLIGPNALAFDGVTDGASESFSRPLRNVTGGGAFWCEIWHRSRASPPRMVAEASIPVDFLGDAGQSTRQTLLPGRTHGQWEKLAVRLQAPATQDGCLRLQFAALRGRNEFDGLSLQPITDRENQALLDFIEGADPQ